ncbi:MAG: cupin domain-containing protein [Planctomycetota bacterium]
MDVPGLRIDGRLDALPWRTTRHEGVDWIDLVGDEADPTRTVLIRMAPGCGYPRHKHVGPEDVLVLDGGYADEDGRTFRAGRFVRYPAGSEHTPVALGERDAPIGDTNRACVLFAVAHGGTERTAAAQARSGHREGGER